MNIVILDGFNEISIMENILIDNLKNSNHTYHYYKINDFDILPCSSCGSCNEVTPGKCLLKDDHEIIIEKIALCDSLVFLTPIKYGGYSSSLKKILDRLMTIGTPFYCVKNGVLLHKMRYEIKNLLTIGEIDKSLYYANQSINSFNLLSSRNALNMNLEVDTFIYDTNDKVETIYDSFKSFINTDLSFYKDSEVQYE